MIDEVKKALSEAKTKEEKVAVVEKYKDELKKLTPEELENIDGGSLMIVSSLAGPLARTAHA